MDEYEGNALKTIQADAIEKFFEGTPGSQQMIGKQLTMKEPSNARPQNKTFHLKGGAKLSVSTFEMGDTISFVAQMNNANRKLLGNTNPEL